MERFAIKAAEALTQASGEAIRASDIVSPPDPKMGDLGFPCFRLAAKLKKGPPVIAQELADKLSHAKIDYSMTVGSLGPYVNFRIPASKLVSEVLKDILGSGYGQLERNSRGTWVLEFSSPNIVKPLNIYHLRGTALGATLARVGRFRGFRVETINHLGDWGTQYGKMAVAYQLFDNELPANPATKDLVEIYVRFHQELEKKPELADQAREAFKRLEANDPAMQRLWQKCVDISLSEFKRIYQRIGVSFDHIWGESFYRDQIAAVMQELKDKKLLVESEGAWVVPLVDEKGREMPPAIMQKNDGTTIYASRDVAAAIFRQKKFQFDRMTYIVGLEQKLHFKQFFLVLKKAGHKWAERCEHVPTGLYKMKGAKMSTRKGTFVTLEECLDLAKSKALQVMAERTTEAGDSADEIAEAVAVGAILFHDQSTDPSRDVDFDLDRIVSFEGETGPYLQYAHTRCLSILRKARDAQELNGDVKYREDWAQQIKEAPELTLLKVLGQFPLQLERTLKQSKASLLATYLTDLTHTFSHFYKECRVLGMKPEITGARLMLVEATRRILAEGLGLLGIPLPKRM